MSDPEFTKEYLRRAFMNGALDVTGDRETLEGFLRIFAGEMEATVAITSATFLTEAEGHELMELARPSAESIAHHRAWLERIVGKNPVT